MSETGKRLIDAARQACRDLELMQMAAECPFGVSWVCPDCDIAGCIHWRQRNVWNIEAGDRA